METRWWTSSAPRTFEMISPNPAQSTPAIEGENQASGIFQRSMFNATWYFALASALCSGSYAGQNAWMSWDLRVESAA